MFFCTIFIWPCDLDLRPFNLGGVWWINIMHPTHIRNFSIPWLSVPELWVTQYDHITITWNGHCMRRVTEGQKWFTFLKSLTPICLFNLSLSRATTRSKPCYRRKIAFFPLQRLQSLLRMHSITWPVHSGPPKPHVTIFWPRIDYSIYNFYAATMTIKGSFILEHPHVRFSVAKSTQNWSPKWRFFGKLRV